jgi:hypothetical protein
MFDYYTQNAWQWIVFFHEEICRICCLKQAAKLDWWIKCAIL